MKSKTVYFCAGWFTDKQNKAYKRAMQAIEDNPTIDVENSYIPLQHQYKGLRVDDTLNSWKTRNGQLQPTMATGLVSKPQTCSW